MALYLVGVRYALAEYNPPLVGYADTSSAMDVPRHMHMMDPTNQHHTTEAGPPRKKGVPNVVATDDATPMMLNANEIVCKDHP